MTCKLCTWCGADVSLPRWDLGYRVCLVCGEEQARQEREDWCIAPMHKSNYATEALGTLGVEMDYLCGSDNQILAVEYPPVSEIKEEV